MTEQKMTEQKMTEQKMTVQKSAADSAQPTTAEIPFIYPAHWEADVVLRDGATAHLRPVVPTDRDALNTMYEGQSERSIYLRFFAPKPKLSDKELTRFTTVDHKDRVAFVLFLGEELIGIGRYDRTHIPTEAEVAFLISDHHQGRGIGSILLEHLAAAARERGIEKFAAEVLPENRKMMNVFTDAGYEVKRAFDDGLVMVEFNIDPTEKSRQVMESREHRAEAKSIAELVAPQSVLVLGDNSVWVSRALPLLENVLQGGYTGKLYGLSLDSTPEPSSDHKFTLLENTQALTRRETPVELALIVVEAEQMNQALTLCGEAGVRGALIYTTGYTHDGARGRARQGALVATARSYGMRIVGPESFGLLNNDPSIKLDTTMTERDPKLGSLGVFSQSATIGAVFSHSAVRRNIGISTLISAGNRADVSGNDLMQYWEDDPQTKVCALYLESVGNPRKFSRIARRLSRVKPLVVAKHTVTGLALPPGHSGRTSIAPAEVLSSMFRQSGVISVDSNESVLDVAQLLVSMPLPAGQKVAVISNAPVLAQMVTDRCHHYDLEVTLKEHTLTFDSADSLEILADVAQNALASSQVDALIGVFLTEGIEKPENISRLLLETARSAQKPVLAIYPGLLEDSIAIPGIFTPAEAENTPVDSSQEPQQISGIPVYEGIAQGVDALAATMKYVEWREKENGLLTQPEGLKPKETQALLAQLMPRVQGDQLLTLSEKETAHILETYGLSLLPAIAFTSVEQAKDAVAELGGYPVVLKSTNAFLSRRLDLGGVRLGIESDEQLAHEIDIMHHMLAGYGEVSLEVQRQAPAGQAVVLKAIEDPLIGPVVSFGMAGDATNLLDDWTHRIPPLTQRDVYKLIRSPRAATKLFERGGVANLKIDLLEDLAARIALLKDNHPEIASISLEPVIVSAQEVSIVHAIITLGNPQQRTDSVRRTMSLSS